MNKVVIVEDEKILCEFVARLINESPMFELVGQSGDGLEGLKLIQERKPDMVVLDVLIPGLNGVNIMRS
ncbi:MAG: response regulator [Verrucomicrobiota bacterium]